MRVERGSTMDLLVTRIEERSKSTQARDRFMHATKEQAIERMKYQSMMCMDQVNTVRNFPYIYTNASVLAESCAHWAFIAQPELRVDDNFWETY